MLICDEYLDCAHGLHLKGFKFTFEILALNKHKNLSEYEDFQLDWDSDFFPCNQSDVQDPPAYSFSDWISLAR